MTTHEKLDQIMRMLQIILNELKLEQPEEECNCGGVLRHAYKCPRYTGQRPRGVK